MIVQQTALFACHERLGAQFAEFANTLLPLRYESEKEEHLAVRKAVGIFDVSHMGEILVSGPAAQSFLNHLLSNNLANCAPGSAQYSLMLNHQGGILDDVIVYSFGENRFMLCVNANNISQDWQWISEQARSISELTIDNASKLFSQIALQGPKAFDLLKSITQDTLPGHFKIQEMLLHNIACLVARTGYTGEDGFEIFLANAAAPELFDYLCKVGENFGLKPCGLSARDSLRLEAGMRLHGVDMDEDTTPLEANLMFAVDMSKSDFIGKDALAKQQHVGPAKILTGFRLCERGVARHGYKVLDKEERPIGEVSSGSWPPTQATAIGFAYVPLAWQKPGTEIFIDIRGRLSKAVVCKAKFLKP